MFKPMIISSMTMKCTSIASCFDGLPDAPVQCQVHHSIVDVHGFTRSHWMLLDWASISSVLHWWAPALHEKTLTKTHNFCWPF